MARQIDFWTLLRMTQEYVSSHYAAVLTDKAKLSQLKAYVDKYLRDNDFKVEGMTTKELIDKLYCEMAEYSILTPFLGSPDLEEINVNGWDDIALTLLDGTIVKLKEHFHSPQHAVDIIKRLREYEITPVVVDYEAESADVQKEYGFPLANVEDLKDLDAIVFAVAHKQYKAMTLEQMDKLFKSCPNSEKIIIDVKSIRDKKELEQKGYRVWRL